MNSSKLVATAALVLMAGAAGPALAQSTAGDVLRVAGAVADAFAPQRQMVLPKPVAPNGQVLSPYTVASMLGAQRYRVNDMRRQGYAYAVDATGPHGNRVIMLIDGRSGVLLGQKVAKWGPGVQRVTVAPRGGWNDAYEFGAVIPASGFGAWAPIGQPMWSKPAARYVATQPSYVAYRTAVPYRQVAVTRQGRTVAHPRPHSGYNIKGYDGQVIAAQNRAEEAEAARMIAEANADEAELNAIDANDVANEALDERDTALDQRDAALDFADEQSAALDEAQKTIAEQQQQIEDTQQSLTDTQQTVEDQNQALDERNQQIDDQSQTIDDQQQQLDVDNQVIDAGNQQIEEQQQEIQQDEQLIDDADQMVNDAEDSADQDPPEDNVMEDSGGDDGGDPGDR